jgi:histidine triad (HIT) family protein
MASAAPAYGDSPVYDDSNVFARILRGELPAFKLYEDDHTLAFMDIMPAADGHMLVIPKGPYRTLIDCPDDVAQRLIVVARKLAIAGKTAFEADGVTLMQFSEAAGGQEVFHIHFHVIPRMEGVPLRPLPRGFADKDLLAGFAERIKAAM